MQAHAGHSSNLRYSLMVSLQGCGSVQNTTRLFHSFLHTYCPRAKKHDRLIVGSHTDEIAYTDATHVTLFWLKIDESKQSIFTCTEAALSPPPLAASLQRLEHIVESGVHLLVIPISCEGLVEARQKIMAALVEKSGNQLHIKADKFADFSPRITVAAYDTEEAILQDLAEIRRLGVDKKLLYADGSDEARVCILEYLTVLLVQR